MLPVLALNAFAAAYDNTNPWTTGCASTSYTATSGNVDQGTLVEKYSTHCQTAWAELICGQSGGCTNFVIWTERVQDQYQTSLHETYPAGVSNGNYVSTNQLNDGPNYSAYVCFQAYGGQAECNGVF
jgi:hypothetical protein